VCLTIQVDLKTSQLSIEVMGFGPQSVLSGLECLIQDLFLFTVPFKLTEWSFERVVPLTSDTAMLKFNNFVKISAVNFTVGLNSSHVDGELSPHCFVDFCADQAVESNFGTAFDELVNQALLQLYVTFDFGPQ